ncbi:MAG: YciI family protein [Polyangiaceae bacterium]
MQYMLLIYENESQRTSVAPEERAKLFEEYMHFTKSIRESGHFRAGDALKPTTTATSVRVVDGKTLTTDGPFAETREQLGGYYLIEAKDLDEATAIAARIPGARLGTIEVRPVMQMLGTPDTSMLLARCPFTSSSSGSFALNQARSARR